MLTIKASLELIYRPVLPLVFAPGSTVILSNPSQDDVYQLASFSGYLEQL